MSLILDALQQSPTTSSQAMAGAPLAATRTTSGGQAWAKFYAIVSLLLIIGLTAFIVYLFRTALPHAILGDNPAAASASMVAPSSSLTGSKGPESRLPAVNEYEVQLAAMAEHIKQRDAVIAYMQRLDDSMVNQAPAFPTPSVNVESMSTIDTEDNDPALRTETADIEPSVTAGSEPAPSTNTEPLQSVQIDDGHDSDSIAPTEAESTAPPERPAPEEFQVQRQTDRQIDDEQTQQQTHRQRIAQHVIGFESAMDGQDLEGAKKHLNQLKTLLPANSLTLLRYQAWMALNNGQEAAAHGYYERILQRVPDDTHTHINLAVIEARRGEKTAALHRLQNLLARQPGQPEILLAIEQLHGVSP